MPDLTGFRGPSSLRVLELASGIAAPYATRLLKDHGASVTKVMADDWLTSYGPPECTRLGSRLFQHLNDGKTMRRVPDEIAAARELVALARDADVIVHDLNESDQRRLGVTVEDLSAVNDAVIVVAVTPFGASGPRVSWLGDDFLAFHASGWAYAFPGAVVPSADLPPLAAPAHAASIMVGTVAALAIASSAFGAARGARGGRYLDLSMQEALAATNQSKFNTTLEGDVTREVSDVPGSAVVSLLECADGRVALSAREQHQWDALLGVLDAPAWTNDPAFSTPQLRELNWPDLYQRLGDTTRGWTVQALVDATQAAGVPCLPFGTVQAIAAGGSGQASGFLERAVDDLLVPARTYQVRRQRESGRGAAARPLASHDLPLAGIRVLDFSWVLSGPLCTRMLASLGAEVLKIESRTRPALSKRDAGWVALNEGKRSLTLNLKTAGARKVVTDLACISDVVVENFSAGVMERLGIDYESLSARHPDLIMASSSSFDRDGPHGGLLAYGTLVQCYTGWAQLSSYPGDIPRSAGGVWADPALAVTQAFAIVMALWRRAAGEGGCHLDLNLADVTVTTLTEALLLGQLLGKPAQQLGNRSWTRAPQGCYPTRAPDTWLAISVGSDAEWAELVEILGAELMAGLPASGTLAERMADHDAIDIAIRTWSLDQDGDSAAATLQDSGIAAYVCQRPDALPDDEQLAERGFFAASAGATWLRPASMALPWTVDGSRLHPRRPAPDLGEATRTVLADLLGLSEHEISTLDEEGALR